MSNDIGLKVGEGVSNGSLSFTEPSKRNIALLMERVRGVENKPFRVTSPSENLARFGGYNANMYGPTITRMMFRNAKGNPLTLYGVRIVGAASVAATSGVTALQVITHEYTAAQEGYADKGDWANGIQIRFYSYDLKKKNAYYVEIYYLGALVENFTAATMAGLQATINSTSMYVMANYSAEYPAAVITAGTGTVTTTTNSTTVTGVGTAFGPTTTPVGTRIYNGANVLVGVVAAITSATVLVLEQNAAVAIAGAAFGIYKRFSETFTLASGVYSAPVESDFYGVPSVSDPKGLNILDGVDCQIIGITENFTLTMTQALNTYLNDRQDPFGVSVYPLNASEAVIASYATALQTTNTSFLSMYNIWQLTSDEQTSPSNVVVPGLGYILGAGFIRTPKLQGDYIHIPPAGQDSAAVDFIECYPKNISQATLNLYARNYSCNSVVFVPRVGYFIMTSRTMSTAALFQSIHIRLQTSYYKRTLEQNMGWVIQKPNSPQLKKQIYAALYSFFKTEYDNGALERSITFEEACAIICDITNNPLSQPRTELNADIDWIPTETTEAIRLSLNRNDGLLTIKANDASTN